MMAWGQVGPGDLFQPTVILFTLVYLSLSPEELTLEVLGPI